MACGIRYYSVLVLHAAVLASASDVVNDNSPCDENHPCQYNESLPCPHPGLCLLTDTACSCDDTPNAKYCKDAQGKACPPPPVFFCKHPNIANCTSDVECPQPFQHDRNCSKCIRNKWIRGAVCAGLHTKCGMECSTDSDCAVAADGCTQCQMRSMPGMLGGLCGSPARGVVWNMTDARSMPDASSSFKTPRGVPRGGHHHHHDYHAMPAIEVRLTSGYNSLCGTPLGNHPYLMFDQSKLAELGVNTSGTRYGNVCMPPAGRTCGQITINHNFTYSVNQITLSERKDACNVCSGCALVELDLGPDYCENMTETGVKVGDSVLLSYSAAKACPYVPTRRTTGIATRNETVVVEACEAKGCNWTISCQRQGQDTQSDALRAVVRSSGCDVSLRGPEVHAGCSTATDPAGRPIATCCWYEPLKGKTCHSDQDCAGDFGTVVKSWDKCPKFGANVLERATRCLNVTERGDVPEHRGRCQFPGSLCGKTCRRDEECAGSRVYRPGKTEKNDDLNYENCTRCIVHGEFDPQGANHTCHTWRPRPTCGSACTYGVQSCSRATKGCTYCYKSDPRNPFEQAVCVPPHHSRRLRTK